MRRGLAFAALDLMGSLLLVVYALINPPVVPAHSAIDTPGRWVVVMSWPYSDNDIDLWLKQPDDRIVYWRNPRSPIAHLEQDDTGIYGDDRRAADNVERMVIRTIEPGEYIVNVHGYAAWAVPVPVTVTLWRLEGADARVYHVQLVVRSNGAELTAFRFTLDANGKLTDLNRLPATLVG